MPEKQKRGNERRGKQEWEDVGKVKEERRRVSVNPELRGEVTVHR